MDKLKSSAIPILLIVIFGIAFAAGIRNLTSTKDGDKASMGAGGLNFASDTAAAFATAKEEGKVVMVKYGAEWCGPCEAMREEAFQDAGVAELLKDVVVVDIDVDNPGADSDWLKEHSVGPIPTVTFFRADGSEIDEFVGYGGIDSFKEDVKKALAKA